MADWNNLLNAEDQLGPLPSWNSSGSAVNEITLPVMECGNSLMTDILESMDQRESEDVPGLIIETIYENESDIESVTTSETLTNWDEGPLILCGMGRISVENETSDSDKSMREKKRHKPSATSKRGILHRKAKKNRETNSHKVP
jgi:hypothetical protein